MYSALERRLCQLRQISTGKLLSGGLIGIERESLRVTEDGHISQTLHPSALGATLTHPHITTDYSEALLELITPPLQSIEETLSFLHDIHTFVYQNLANQEFLWSSSMPCSLNDGAKIPLAQYGSSNAGQMKTIYRRGLGHRYGRVMQVIAGIHYNYSLPDNFWPIFKKIEGSEETLCDFKSEAYFGMVRNLQRFGWIVPYLFGSSPAVCRSFVADRATSLEFFNLDTLYEQFGTSLRMGDIGYTNSKEDGVGIKANYDNLASYVLSLQGAINTPSDVWKGIGIQVNGRYEQLNDHILQIENEYYSTVRPKQTPQAFEKPSTALKNRGVQYVELRSMDVNPFDPVGISPDQALFLEMFMIYCLLMDSPIISQCERQEIDHNFESVAHKGRCEHLRLERQGSKITLQAWGSEICTNMRIIAQQLDSELNTDKYSNVLKKQQASIENSALTLSAQVLAEMRQDNKSFFQFAYDKSQQHIDYFTKKSLTPAQIKLYQQEVCDSLEAINKIENTDEENFDDFLQAYMRSR